MIEFLHPKIISQIQITGYANLYSHIMIRSTPDPKKSDVLVIVAAVFTNIPKDIKRLYLTGM